MLRVEVIRSFDRLQQIAGQWNALADSIEGVTPFQLPAWQLTWWRHFGSGNIHSFAFWNNQHLSGLIPAFRHLWEGRRQITLIGSGISDYLEPLLADSKAVELLSCELANDPAWDVCLWQDLAAETPLSRIISLHATTEPDMPCSAIPLTLGTFEGFWGKRGPDLRRNIKRYAAKAEAQGGPMHFAVHPIQSELIDTLIDLHARRWQKQGQAGMVELNRSGDFLREITAIENCRIFSLRWKDEVVAITAGFLRERTIYSYLSAFDPHYEILGFGRFLLYQSLQWAKENGFTRWDFLRGTEAYKASWGAEVTPKLRLVITRS